MPRNWLRAAAPAVAACALGAVILSADRLARAQQPSDADRFTGRSRTLDGEGARISRRWFEAGARSAWHRHVDGQLLFVQKGRARVQHRGEPMRELDQGESDYTAPNVEHWHGATPDEELTQLAVSFGDAVEWLAKVTDDEYHGR
jgi:quercetin dioxygenase-like cupin family protein